MDRETRPPKNTAEEGSSHKRRLLLNLLALVAAVLLAQAAYVGYSSLLGPGGTTPAQIELREADTFYSLERQQQVNLTYQPTLRFTASGAPGEGLLLKNHRVERGRAEETWSRAFVLDASGALTSSVTGLHEGLNLLAAAGEQEGHYLWLLPRDEPHDLSGVTRTLAISLTPTQLSAAYQATFAPGANDADLYDLLAGRIEPALFLKRIFYSTSDSFSSKHFDDVSTPQVAIREGVSHLEIQAVIEDAQVERGQLAALLNVSLPQEPPSGAATSVTVEAGKGIAVRSYSPLPTVAGGRSYGWIDEDLAEPIRLSYDVGGEIDPISAPVLSVRRIFQRALEPLWQRLGNAITLVLLGIVMPALLLLPFAWLWLHVKRHPTVLAGEDSLLLPLESGGGLAIAVFVGFLVGIWLLGSSGAVWAAALCCVIPLILHRYPKLPLRWLWLILSSLLTAAALSLLVCATWKPALLVALAGAPLLLFSYWLSRELNRPGAFLDSDLRPWSGRVRLVGLLLSAILLAYPVTQLPYYYSPLGGWWPVTGHILALLTTQALIPLAALLAVLGLLRRQGRSRVTQEQIREAESAGSWATAAQKIRERLGKTLEKKRQSMWALDGELLTVGQFLLAYFALGVMRRPLVNTDALIPIAPILGWVLFRRLVRRPEKGGPSYTERVMLASERLRESIGGAALGQATAQEAEEEADPSQAGAGLKSPQDSRRKRPLRDVLFGWGDADRPWENAKAACTRGGVLVAVLLILYGPAILHEALQQTVTPFILLETLVVPLVPFVARWLLYAFILGYFFPYIRGRHGWQKGLYLALTISACTLVQDVVMQAHSVDDVLGLLLEAGQAIVYLSIVGIWAFDWPRIKEAGGGAKELLRTVYGLPFLTSYLSGLAPALAGIVQSAISGRFNSIVQTFVETVLPTISQFGKVP